MKNLFLIITVLFSLQTFGQETITETNNTSDKKNQFSNNIIPTAEDILVNESYDPIVGNLLSDNILFAYSFDGKLKAYDLDKEEEIWSFRSKDSVKGTTSNRFTIDRGIIYIPFENGEIYAVNGLTGKAFWKSKIGFIDNKIILWGQKPPIFNNKVYFTSINKNVYALNTKNGELEWNYKLAYKFNQHPFLLSHDMLFVPNAPYVYNFDAETGKPLYQRGFKKAMYSTPASNSKYIYVANESDILFALKPENLDIIWEFTIEDNQYNIDEKLKADAHYVYLATWSNPTPNIASVYCLKDVNGEKKWKTDFKDDNIQYIDIYNNSIYGYTEKGLFFELDKNTGKIIQKVALNYLPVSNLELYNKDNLLYYAKEGIIKLNLKTTQESILFSVDKPTISDTNSYIKISNNVD